MLDSGFHAIPAGHVAAIVTHLTMTARPSPRVAAFPDGVAVERIVAPDPTWYLDLFSRVGAADWMWFSRLAMPPAKLAEILAAPETEVFAVIQDGRPEGLLELDFRDDGSCMLAFFGLTLALQGTGTGRALMEAALDRAFARPITSLDIHTCTFDSPVALPFYLRSGFTATHREVQVVRDPRLDGTLLPDAAPQIPVIAGG